MLLGTFHELAWQQRSRVDSSEVPQEIELGNGKAKRGVACCHGKISGKSQDFGISRVDARAASVNFQARSYLSVCRWDKRML